MKNVLKIAALLVITVSSPAFANKVYIGDKNPQGTKTIIKDDRKEFVTCMNSLMNANFGDFKDEYLSKDSYKTSISEMALIYDKQIQALEKMRDKQIALMKKVDTNKDGQLDKTELLAACKGMHKNKEVMYKNYKEKAPIHKPYYNSMNNKEHMKNKNLYSN